MNDQFNITDYTFSEQRSHKEVKHKVRMKHDGLFMCVPEYWAVKAFSLARQQQSPGPVIIGLILWQKFRMEHGKQPLKITNPMLNRFDLKRPFFSKWLAPMETAGLITVQRFKNRSPLITVLTGEQCK